MSKVIKQMQMDVLKGTFQEVRDMVFLGIVGLDATTENKMRLDLRKKGVRLHQVKNTLARRVFNEMGMTVEKPWAGRTTVAWGVSRVPELSQEMDGLRR